jgi:DNA-binding response OmpR family regulator
MPRQLPEIDPVEPPRTAASLVRFTPPRSILILESDPSIRKLLRRLLDRRGYFTHEVIEPGDLAAELRERRVDLLIIDLPLMGGNGLDAAFALARVHPDLKVLALSLEPLDSAEIPGRCLALAKPFSLEMFVACADRLLEPAIPAAIPSTS